MAQIYYYKKKEEENLKVKDLMKLFIAHEYDNDDLTFININNLEESLAKTSKIGRYGLLFKEIQIEEKDGKEYIDIMPVLEELEKEGIIKIEPFNHEIFIILLLEKEAQNIRTEYSKKINDKFADSLFFVNHDLKYGLDGWELCFEDEYLEVPGYPGIVTGEFIDQEKTSKVKVQIKKRCQERIKNLKY